MRSAAILIAAAALALAAARYCGSALDAERTRLGIDPEPAAPLPSDLGAPSPGAQAAVVSAALGVIRPLVIDYLMLRAELLERQGSFSESVALARAVTSLQPRLPQLWVFQAFRLANDLAAEAPPRDRFAWCLEGIRLLRDGALEENPRSARIYAGLAYLFLQRIDHDGDSAHVLLKERLARSFEDEGLAARDAEVLRRWKIDERLLDEAGAAYGLPPLDPRHAASHALYWTHVGLAAAPLDRDRAGRAQLLSLRALALRALLARGRIVVQPAGRLHAFLPDLRCLAGARRSFTDELERFAADPALLRDIEEDRRVFSLWLAVYQSFWGEKEAAAAALRDAGEEGRRWPTVDRFLVEVLGAGEDPRGAEPVARAARLLRAAHHLELARGEDLDRAAAACRHFAALLVEEAARLRPERPPPGIGVLRDAVARDLLARWSSRPDLQPLARELEASLDPRPGSGAAGTPTLDELGAAPSDDWPPALAPFVLENLDPLRDLEEDL